MAEDPRIPVLSNFELRALAETGSRAVLRAGDGDGLPYDASENRSANMRNAPGGSRKKRRRDNKQRSTSLIPP